MDSPNKKRSSSKTSNNKQSTVTLNPAKRVKQYGSIFTEKKGLLFCRICDQEVSFLRKSTIDNHLKSKNHIQNQLVARNENTSLDHNPIDTNNFDTRETKNDVAHDFMKAFASADIPVCKLEHKAIRNLLDKYVPGILLPSVNLASKSLPAIQEETLSQIKANLKNKKVAILVEESTDQQQRYFFQMLILELNIFGDCKHYLADTVFLDEVTYETVAQACLICVVKYQIDFNNVIAFASDDVSYMKKAYQDVLSKIFLKCRHVTCNAHIESLVGASIRDNLPQIDSLIYLIKIIFSKDLKRKGRYIDYLKSQGVEKAVLPPTQLSLRWLTWFNATMYINDYYDHLRTFVYKEIQSQEATHELVRLEELFKNKDLRAEVEFVVQHCQTLINLNQQFQHKKVNLTKVYDAFFHQYKFLNERVFKYSHDEKKKLILNSASVKLKKYIIDGGQTAMSIYHVARIFDPYFFAEKKTSIQDYIGNLPDLQHCYDEWNIYTNLSIEYTDHLVKPDETNLLTFWLVNKDKMPNLYKFATWILAYPTSISEVERSINSYKKMIKLNRNSLSKDNIKSLYYVQFNNEILSRSSKSSLNLASSIEQMFDESEEEDE